MNRFVFACGISLFALVSSSTTDAQTSTETYTYDALGRLVKVKTTGGQNNNETDSICYDDAGNRTTYQSTNNGGAAACVNDGSGGAPPPPPPPSTIQITDNNLNVLPAHQAQYGCAIGSYQSYSWELCWIKSSGVYVYNAAASPKLDPGYSMPAAKRLEVTNAAYGTGVSP